MEVNNNLLKRSNIGSNNSLKMGNEKIKVFNN